MVMRTKAQWIDLLQRHKGTHLAEFVLDDLMGDRKTSLKRSYDVDTLTSLFEAIREDQKYKDY